MRLRVGDQVKFLNDTGGGTVTRILNKDMVQVLNEDGFEVPVLSEELLKTGDEQRQEAYAQEAEEETYDSFEEEVPGPEALSSAADPGNHIYFAFLPMDATNPVNGDLEVYLINDSDFFVYYLILLKRGGAWVYFSSGDLEDNMKTFIKTIEKDRLNEIGHFRFQFLFYQKSFFQPVSPMEVELHWHPRKFFRSTAYTENDFFEEPAMVIELQKEEDLYKQLSSLGKEDITQAIQEKEYSERDEKKTDRPKSGQSDREEVDLHIEELVDKPKELSNQEMLDIQMSRFQTSLEGALKTPKTQKIVFIHGVGNGRLRYEIRKHLDRYYPNLDYQDASFKEYGYGATLVFVGK
jgi:hypothetical protein